MMYEHTLCHCVPPPIQMSMWHCLYKIVHIFCIEQTQRGWLTSKTLSVYVCLSVCLHQTYCLYMSVYIRRIVLPHFDEETYRWMCQLTLLQVRCVSAYTVVQVRDMWKLTLWYERHVSAYTVVQVRDVWKLTLWCERRESLHCGVRDTSAYTVVQVRHVSAYTVVQVRDTCQLTLSCKLETCQLSASERHVKAYTVVRVRDACQLTLWCKLETCQLTLWRKLETCQLTLWCKWETCESLHCGASERHVKAYTVVQVRDMWKLTLWCKWETCESLHCGSRPHCRYCTYSPSHLFFWNINHMQREFVIRD